MRKPRGQRPRGFFVQPGLLEDRALRERTSGAKAKEHDGYEEGFHKLPWAGAKEGCAGASRAAHRLGRYLMLAAATALAAAGEGATSGERGMGAALAGRGCA